MTCLRTLSRRYGGGLRITKFLSRCALADLPVSESDSPEDISGQWRQLNEKLQEEGSVLLYHLENHYSPIFGSREWGFVGSVKENKTEREILVRQILVGKPGQRPNRWIDWDDVRGCLLGWKGYGVVLVTKVDVAGGADQ
jgi:hypothetical protein